MTRQYNAQYHCNNCKTWQTQETMFGRWIRNNKALESSKGYCVTDQDYWIHRFKTFGKRNFQLIMGIEIKTMGGMLSDAQKDTVYLLDQMLRNRRQTPTNSIRKQAGSGLAKIYSIIAKRPVVVKAFGMHVLTFSGLGPDDSEVIRWDKTEIDEGLLTEILRFDLDPDTLLKIDLRSHHSVSEDANQMKLKLENAL